MTSNITSEKKPIKEIMNPNIIQLKTDINVSSERSNVYTKDTDSPTQNPIHIQHVRNSFIKLQESFRKSLGF